MRFWSDQQWTRLPESAQISTIILHIEDFFRIALGIEPNRADAPIRGRWKYSEIERRYACVMIATSMAHGRAHTWGA